MKVLAICGSLRRDSFNKRALLAAAKVAPAGMTVTLFDRLKEIPMLDTNDLKEKPMPNAVVMLKDAIYRADGVLFGCPEYNFSLSGALKNAIDWVSRDTSQPFARKPYAIVSASMGMLGGARAQYDLRKVLIYLNGQPLNTPELIIGQAHEKFDASGELLHPATREAISAQMAAFAEHIKRVQRAFAPA